MQEPLQDQPRHRTPRLKTSGVDRSGLKSLWSPSVRWTEVTEEGFAGGEVIPQSYNGSADSLDQLRNNVLKSGQVGRLVASPKPKIEAKAP